MEVHGGVLLRGLSPVDDIAGPRLSGNCASRAVNEFAWPQSLVVVYLRAVNPNCKIPGCPTNATVVRAGHQGGAVNLAIEKIRRCRVVGMTVRSSN